MAAFRINARNKTTEKEICELKKKDAIGV